jgi:hypothetical protein
VALSRRAQPIWFRVVKWLIILLAAALWWRKPLFWWWVLGALILSMSLHAFWRWKTKGWTQPWGGWNDLEAGRRDERG